LTICNAHTRYSVAFPAPRGFIPYAHSRDNADLFHSFRAA